MSARLSEPRADRLVHVTHARKAGGGLEVPLGCIVCGENTFKVSQSVTKYTTSTSPPPPLVHLHLLHLFSIITEIVEASEGFSQSEWQHGKESVVSHHRTEWNLDHLEIQVCSTIECIKVSSGDSSEVRRCSGMEKDFVRDRCLFKPSYNLCFKATNGSEQTQA